MIRGLITRALLALALIIGVLTLTAAPASAVDRHLVAAATVIAFTLPPTLIIGALVSTVLPLLVGLVTTSDTNPRLKAILLAALAAVTGLLTELGATWSTGTTYDLGVGLLTALTAFLAAVGLHFGLYKPTGLSAKLQAVGTGKPPA